MPPHPADVQAALAAPLYTRVTSLMLGHIATLGVCGLAMIRIGGAWPAAFTAASFAVSFARVLVLVMARRSAATGTLAQVARRRRTYQAVGLAWSAIGGAAMGSFCMLGDRDEVLRLLAIILALGVSSGIASRNAATPRFAMAQIGLWILPVMVFAPFLGPWYWIVSVMVVCYAAALGSIVRQQYIDTIALLGAERSSRRASTALAEREAELHALFQNVSAGFADFHIAKNRTLRVNPELCRILARTEAELLAIGDPKWLVHPDDRAAHAAHWAAIVANGMPIEYDARLLRPDGATVSARINASVVSIGRKGTPTRLAAVVQDITERLAADAALRTSEEMLRLSLDIGRIGIYRRDMINQTIQAGLETRLMHGLSTDVDTPIPEAQFFAMILPEDRDRVMAQLAEIYAEHRQSVSFEYRFIHPQDGIRHIETRSRVRYDAAGQPQEALGVIIDVTERRDVQERFAHLAHHDSLTGLPNRTLFRARLDEALARALRSERFAVCYLDLDHFKFVNDALGHPVGDLLLQGVTARLLAAVRPTDTVARLGGDEFAVIQSGVAEAEDVTVLAQRLIDSISAPYDIDGHHVVIGTSIGITLSPDDGLDATLLLRHADTALYAAKEAGRGRYRFFEPEMDARMRARRVLELDLRGALDTGAFELFYQPIVKVASRALCGFEALLRWHHPTRGMIMPDRFVALAESNGIIVPIGEWVLRQACAVAAAWPAGTRIAVNLSAVQFTSNTLLGAVAAALAESGLDPARLELEITESAMLLDTESTLDKLHQLKALGVGIAMDDFGTGYSSLGYLQRFPFNRVKIDRSFITHLGDSRESAAVVGAVIALCAGLDMDTTAEGVETESQLAALATIGCTEAQGFLFSPPAPARDIPRLMHRLQDARGLVG